jgi:hypothetical protein
VEKSTNGRDWTTVGGPILGSGNALSWFEPFANSPKTVFRIAISNSYDDGKSVPPVSLRNFAFKGKDLGGAELDGFYVFDSATPDSEPSAQIGSYYQRCAQCGFWVRIGGLLFRSSAKGLFDYYIETGIGSGSYTYLVASGENACTPPWCPEYIMWQLDINERAFSDDSLSSTPIDLSAFEIIPHQQIGIQVMGKNNSFNFRGYVESLMALPATIEVRPSLVIQSAHQLSWESSLGRFYQVQSSHNGVDWNNEGEPLHGIGGVMEKYFERSNVSIYYRVQLIR